MLTRRQAMQRTVLATTAISLGFSASKLEAQAPPAPTDSGPFKLPPLPYAFDALEPHIDAKTMQIHHDKHHATYVTNLNKAVVDHPDLGKKSIEELMRDLNAVPESVKTAVRNQGGGHLNHSLFWQMMSKNGGGEPKGELAKAFEGSFGSFDKFKTDFTKAATSVFGSGWAWVTMEGKALKIETSPNQDSPVSSGRVPLLGLDVWEHAYYLKYQNKRPDYIAAFYNVINWDFVAEQYAKKG